MPTRVLLVVAFAYVTACARQGLDEAAGDAAPAVARVPAQHRATHVCPAPVPTNGVADCRGSNQRPFPPGFCNVDSDCTDGLNVRCSHIGRSGVCECLFDFCASDEDCPAGQACACNPYEIGNNCVPASCRVDGDCGEGGFCGPLSFGCNGAIGSYQCYTSQDQCIADSDCPSGQRCYAEPSEARWRCHAPVMCHG